MALTDDLSARDLAMLRKATLRIHYHYFPSDKAKRVRDYSQVDMLINSLSGDAVYAMIRDQVDNYENH